MTIHKTAVEDMAALKKERSEKSGFNKAVKSDGGKPSVQTGQFIKEARRLAETTRSDEVRDAVNNFAGKLTNKPLTKAGPGEPTVKAIKAVSIKQARETSRI